MENLFEMLEPVEVKEEAKKNRAAKKENKTVETADKNKKYKYPFEIYLAAEKKDVSFMFENGKEYTGAEITKSMLEHGFYEFAGNVTYDFIEKDNVLVPIFQQHKKG